MAVLENEFELTFAKVNTCLHMDQKDIIKEFLSMKRIAVIGVSRAPNDYSRMIYQRLKDNQYEVFAVNPNFGTKEKIEGDPVFQDITKIPGPPVDAAFLVTSPEVSAKVTKECVDYGVKRIWMHRSFGNGSYSPQAEEYCRKHKIPVITKGCVMMYCRPVDGAHRFFRWILGCPKI